MGKPMTLKEWINCNGAVDTAKLLKVTPATVRHWMRGFCLPRAEQMLLIKKYSKGAVSYDVMIESHFKKTNTKRSSLHT